MGKDAGAFMLFNLCINIKGKTKTLVFLNFQIHTQNVIAQYYITFARVRNHFVEFIEKYDLRHHFLSDLA